MINIYVGPAIGNVAARHALEGGNVLRTQHIPRWREGGLDGAVMQVANWSLIGMVMSEIRQSEGEIVFCRNRADYEEKPQGSFGIFLSVEGYESFAGDLDAIYTLTELGITAFTFSHNVQNLLCTGCNERHGEGGFTHLGKATLKELEKVPMMVDLVHTSRASFWDALDIYEGDIFVSHTDADAVHPHPRNLTDDQIRAVAERNGVIGLNSYRGYVRPDDPFKATLSDWLDHAIHIYSLVGPEHLAIGADYYEGPLETLTYTLNAVDPEGAHGLHGVGGEIYAQGPAGVENAGKLGNLVAGLAERGLEPDEIALVCGGSYLAMLERVRPSLEAARA